MIFLLVYNNSFTYNEPFKVVFLCGNRYLDSDPREKRKVLKEFLESRIMGCKVIILEENFIFGRTNKKYLSYDDIFLVDLASVEQLTSIYAHKIIIIHETLSTAAELGMFAINPRLASKICLLVPDDIAIEEKKVTTFIKLAFYNKKSRTTKIGKKITYYPDLEVCHYSSNKSGYYTYFHNNEIGENLGNKIVSFVDEKGSEDKIKFVKSKFNKPIKNENNITYFINKKEKTVNVFIYIYVLKIQLLGLFFINKYRTEFRKPRLLKDHISYIIQVYEEIHLNTISEIEGVDLDDYSIKIKVMDSEICKFRQVVGYYLYILQAIGLINLEKTNNNSEKRKIKIKNELDTYKESIADLINEKHTTMFGRLDI